MIKKFLIPAACSPSTICRRIGFPRTLIIVLGSSDVSSRIRVPRPAASRTALSIFVITDVAPLPHLGAWGGLPLPRGEDCGEGNAARCGESELGPLAEEIDDSITERMLPAKLQVSDLPIAQMSP